MYGVLLRTATRSGPHVRMFAAGVQAVRQQIHI